MKIKFFISLLSFCSLFMAFSLNIKAQNHLKNGIAVMIKSEFKKQVRVDNSEGIPIEAFEIVSKQKPIIHRILPDKKNKIYFGYDLEVLRSSEPNTFLITLKPLSLDVAKFFPELKDFVSYPLPKYSDFKTSTVKAGDILGLAFLINPQTKESIVEYLKVDSYSITSGAVTAYAEGVFINSFSELKETRDFTLDDVVLKLGNFEIFVNGERVGQMSGGGSGANLYFTVPGKGRFILSPFARKGYEFQKIGVVIDNRLSFTYEGVKYQVVSKDSILGENGNWYIWILYDPKFEWKGNPKNPLSIIFGSADKIDYFFKRPY